MEERIIRNKSTFRLEQKASKRNLEGSERYLLDVHYRRQHNTNNDFYYTENYIKINNTRLSPEEAARRIMDKFGLQPAIQVLAAGINGNKVELSHIKSPC